MLLIIPPKPVRRRRLRGAAARRPAPPGPLVLVSASFDDVNLALTLTFDRAVDASGMVGNAVVVDDAAGTGLRYEAIAGVTVVTPETVALGMADFAAATGTGVRLTATSANGIVAAGDGAAWAGVTGLELPFGD